MCGAWAVDVWVPGGGCVVAWVVGVWRMGDACTNGAPFGHEACMHELTPHPSKLCAFLTPHTPSFILPCASSLPPASLHTSHLPHCTPHACLTARPTTPSHHHPLTPVTPYPPRTSTMAVSTARALRLDVHSSLCRQVAMIP